MRGTSGAVQPSFAIRLTRAIVGFLIFACAAMVLVDLYRDALTENSLAAISSAGGLTMRNEGVRSRPVIGIDLDATTVFDTGEIRQRTRASDATLLIVARFAQLEELSLAGADVTDAGMVSLSGLNKLRRLNVSGTRVTDTGLTHLNGLRELRFVDLRETRVTPTGARKLQLALPEAEVRADY
jgi:Leucine Rich repeat